MKSIKLCLISILLTLMYLGTSVLISNVLCHHQASGSLLKLGDNIIGSRLIGQNFESNHYFHGRPSANKYKNNISGCSNLPYSSQELKESVLSNQKNALKKNLTNSIDMNLITESASGLDPHITHQGAISQIHRISYSTKIAKDTLTNLINSESKPQCLGIFGERIINVLELNLKIKELYAKKTRT